MRLAVLATAAFVLAAGTASAASYRCTDGSGRVAYMERPCEAYGMKTEKTIKDVPKGDGSQNALGTTRPVLTERSPQGEARTADRTVPMMCGEKRVRCFPGDILQCGDRRITCDSD